MISAYPLLNINRYMRYIRVGLNLNPLTSYWWIWILLLLCEVNEFEFNFAKLMNLNLKDLIKYSMNLIVSNQNLHCESSDL